MSLDWLQYPGSALSLIGAFLVAQSTSDRRRLGFFIWIASNVLLIAWAFDVRAWGLVAMYLVFLGTSGMGAWNNRVPTVPSNRDRNSRSGAIP